MNQIRSELDHLGFTSQEKQALTARLEQAASQSEHAATGTTRKKGAVSRGMIAGLAAACLMTVGVFAATFSPGLRSYLKASTPGAQETLEQGIYQLDRSLSHNGWTVELAECVGDDNGLYLWIDVIAPEGTVLTTREGGNFEAFCQIELPEGTVGACGELIFPLPDHHPEDNRISFCLNNTPVLGDLRGESVTITLGPITDYWVTDSAQLHKGSTLTEAIRDYTWVFDDVRLNYPDQTIRLNPNVEVPYLDGSATLTKLEISPLNTRVRIEGGSCTDHHRLFPQPDEEASASHPYGSDCFWAMGVELHMKDGSVYQFREDASSGRAGSNCQDGRNPYYEGALYVEGVFQYAHQSDPLGFDSVLDPAQVDYVVVCGQKIFLDS